MLKGISPLISPKLLKALATMGHGDEIVLADAHFPSETLNTRVIRADGLVISVLLEAILPLIELDSYVPTPLIMMAAIQGDQLNPLVESTYLKSIHKTNPNVNPINKIERYEFYERAKQAYAIVITGETARYGNILLRKGVTNI